MVGLFLSIGFDPTYATYYVLKKPLGRHPEGERGHRSSRAQRFQEARAGIKYGHAGTKQSLLNCTYVAFIGDGSQDSSKYKHVCNSFLCNSLM